MDAIELGCSVSFDSFLSALVGSLKYGSLSQATETAVTPDAWYLTFMRIA